MGRVLRFRYWDIEKKRMLTTVCPEFFDLTQDIADYFKGELVVMQFTGLTDRNGKEIYEGDIVKAGWHWDTPHAIVWPDDYYDVTEYALDGADMEILGNIYEHPELLT